MSDAKKCSVCGNLLEDQGEVIFPESTSNNRTLGGPFITSDGAVQAHVFLCGRCGRIELYAIGAV